MEVRCWPGHLLHMVVYLCTTSPFCCIIERPGNKENDEVTDGSNIEMGAWNQLKTETLTLTGKRAKLVPMATSHIEGLYEAGRDPGIWTYMPLRMTGIADAERLVQEALKAREQGSEFPFVIIDQETDRIVGSTRYMEITPAHRALEIGWTWLSPEVWRTRINTECKYLLLRYGFEALQAVRVQLKTDMRNLRSQQAIERLGAVREGVLRHHRILPDGYRRDTVYFSILEAEWPAVKARLEGFLEAGGPSPV